MTRITGITKLKALVSAPTLLRNRDLPKLIRTLLT